MIHEQISYKRDTPETPSKRNSNAILLAERVHAHEVDNGIHVVRNLVGILPEEHLLEVVGELSLSAIPEGKALIADAKTESQDLGIGN